jgi:hypothetical protein
MIISLLAIGSFVSCTVEPSDYSKKNPMKHAYSIFQYWQFGLCNTQMRFANVAFNFNTWLSADEGAKDSIAQQYFKDVTIRENGGGSWSLLVKGVEKCVIETNNQSLSAMGARWTVTEKEILANYIPNGNFDFYRMYGFTSNATTATIECQKQGSWFVNVNYNPETDSLMLGGPAPHLSVVYATPDQSVICDLRDGNYSINGHGCFEFNALPYGEDQEVVALYFQIEEPLFCNRQDAWNEGVSNITVSTGYGPSYKNETVKAEFLPKEKPTVKLYAYNRWAICTYNTSDVHMVLSD